MSKLISTTTHTPLANHGMELHDLEQAVDGADLYFECVRMEPCLLEGDKIKASTHNIEQGVLVRVISGEKNDFTHSDKIYQPALQQTRHI